jgi:hypothetical protein
LMKPITLTHPSILVALGGAFNSLSTDARNSDRQQDQATGR